MKAPTANRLWPGAKDAAGDLPGLACGSLPGHRLTHRLTDSTGPTGGAPRRPPDVLSLPSAVGTGSLFPQELPSACGPLTPGSRPQQHSLPPADGTHGKTRKHVTPGAREPGVKAKSSVIPGQPGLGWSPHLSAKEEAESVGQEGRD